MRVTMDLQRRMIDAAMHLRSAIELRAKAAGRTMSEMSKEILDQADVHQAIGYSLMDFTSEQEKSAGTLITPTPDIDLKQTDPLPISPRTVSENQ